MIFCRAKKVASIFSFKTLLWAFVPISVLFVWLGATIRSAQIEQLQITSLRQSGNDILQLRARSFNHIIGSMLSRISGASPEAFEEVDGLEVNNSSPETAVALREASSLKALSSLSFLDTQVTYSLVSPFAATKTITDVNAGRCTIERDAFRCICEYRSLKSIQLTASRLSDVGGPKIELPRTLDSLSILYCENEVLENVDWRTCGSLRRICFNGIRLSSTDISKITLFPQLRELSLKATGITDEELRVLSVARTLNVLDIAHNAVSDQGLGFVGASLTGLENLSLSNTLITDSCVDDLNHLIDLRELRADECGLSDAFLDKLKCPRLKTLVVISDSVTSDGVIAFRAKHPQCQVVWQR